MATIRCRFTGFKGCDMTVFADLTGYTDAEKVSVWAAEDIIEGISSSSGDSARARVTTVFMRFCKEIAK